MSVFGLGDLAFLGAVGTSTALWTPANITTALWLDAEDSSTLTLVDSNVSQWRDKSGNGNHQNQASVAARPAYQATDSSTGKATLSFNGTSSFMSGNITSPVQLRNMSAIDVVMVLQSTAAAAADTNTLVAWGYRRDAATPVLFFWASTTGTLSGERIAFILNPGVVTATTLGSSTYSRSANSLQILNTQNSQAGTALFVNGSSVSLDLSSGMTTSTSTAPSALSVGSDSFTLGATGGPDNVIGPACKISEVVVGSSLFSVDNRQRIEGYLAHKWGIAASLPSSHPFKSAAPTI